MRVCKEVVAKDVEDFQPDVVIVATGATMVRPEVTKGKPGIMTYVEATRKRGNIGDKVVIWGLSAAELAVSLAQEGKNVTLIGRGDESTLAPERDARPLRRIWLLRRLTDNLEVFRERPEYERLPNAQVLFHTDVLDIVPEGVQALDKKTGEKNVIPYDTLIISLNREQNVALYDALKDKVPEIHKIGDCSNISDIKEAIFTANEIVRKI